MKKENNQDVCECGHLEKSHRNRPYGKNVIATWCHVKGCDCKSFRKKFKPKNKKENLK